LDTQPRGPLQLGPQRRSRDMNLLNQLLIAALALFAFMQLVDLLIPTP
jgi:hypothetical protein